MRTLPAIIVIAALVAGAAYLAAEPGSVVLTWQGRHIYTSVARLALGIVLLAMLAAALFHLLRKLLGGPRAFMRGRREKRRREGYRALTQGMVAVAAGDAEEAQKFARKADVLLAEPPLTLLLSAQAAQLSGDEQAAARYFTAMLERAETEFLGLRGLVMQALRGGDERAALGLVERARRLRPRTPWVVTSLFELQARAGKWYEAEQTLIEGVKRKALPEAATHHHRTVLLHERSRAAEAEGAQPQALQLAAKAHGAELGFAPGAVHYATLLRVGGRTKHAARALEASWRVAPHPDIAAGLGRALRRGDAGRADEANRPARRRQSRPCREPARASAGGARRAALGRGAPPSRSAGCEARRGRGAVEPAGLPDDGRTRRGAAREHARGAGVARAGGDDDGARSRLALRRLRRGECRLERGLPALPRLCQPRLADARRQRAAAAGASEPDAAGGGAGAVARRRDDDPAAGGEDGVARGAVDARRRPAVRSAARRGKPT